MQKWNRQVVGTKTQETYGNLGHDKVASGIVLKTKEALIVPNNKIKSRRSKDLNIQYKNR